jgi:periplasmic protein TonB
MRLSNKEQLMEKSNILNADVLDILFDGRNKEYGAYDLRRTYNKRMVTSITVMLSTVCIVSMSFAFAGKKTDDDIPYMTKDIELASVETPKKPIEMPPPPAPKPPAPPEHMNLKTIKNTAYDIVADDKVPENEKPPQVTELDNAVIGTFNKNGDQPDGTVIAPPGDPAGTGVTAITRDVEEEDAIILKVEIESEYPGGLAAWQRFLYKNLRYPQEAIDNEIQGAVVVQFIVDKEGNVSDIEAVSGPAELRAEAVRVIKKSGKWTPAIQNGRKVKSYKKQPIGFRINVE